MAGEGDQPLMMCIAPRRTLQSVSSTPTSARWSDEFVHPSSSTSAEEGCQSKPPVHQFKLGGNGRWRSTLTSSSEISTHHALFSLWLAERGTKSKNEPFCEHSIY